MLGPGAFDVVPRVDLPYVGLDLPYVDRGDSWVILGAALGAGASWVKAYAASLLPLGQACSKQL